MAIKKSELYSTLWKCCDELRGGMDAGNTKIMYWLFSSWNTLAINTKLIRTLWLKFRTVVLSTISSHWKVIAISVKRWIRKWLLLAEANGLDNVINVADFCDEQKLGKGKDLVETLSGLIGVFENSDLDFGRNRASDDDLMGDAYEYLMKNFATESGKSKGQFYTPAEVSRVMAKVLGLDKVNSTALLFTTRHAVQGRYFFAPKPKHRRMRLYTDRKKTMPR